MKNELQFIIKLMYGDWENWQEWQTIIDDLIKKYPEASIRVEVQG